MSSRHALMLDVHVFLFTDTATTEIYTLSLHDALPISQRNPKASFVSQAASPTLTTNQPSVTGARPESKASSRARSEEHTSELQSHSDLVCRLLLEKKKQTQQEQLKKTTHMSEGGNSRA